MDNDCGINNFVNRPAHKNKRNKFVRCEDPELAAEIRYAKENGTAVPTVLASSPVEVKVIPQSATILQDIKKVAPNQTKMSKKTRNRGVSGCAIKKDGGRFEFGLEDIYLTEEHVDESLSEDEGEMKKRVKRTSKESSSRANSTDEDIEENYGKIQLKCIVLDYFENGDLDEAIESIRKYSTAKNCLVACAAHVISAHLEGGSSWGLLASALLERLMEEDLISRYTLMKAIEEVLLNLDELVIDHPHAVSMISHMFARFLSDQLITGDIFAAITLKFTGNKALAFECCTRTIAYAKNPLTIDETPSGDHLPIAVLSKQLKLVLKEYLINNEIHEAAQRTLKLKVPHFSHELVYLAGEMAMEKMQDSVMDQLAILLKYMLEEGEILESCVVKGFIRLFAAIPGMSLDLPAVYSLASLWTKKCLRVGLINSEIAASCPTTVRGRLLSEGPNGKLVCMDENSLDSGISGSVSEC